jgi:3-oxoadipate enol-lactonase/4-carboxymuconolactone decarboxylase
VLLLHGGWGHGAYPFDGAAEALGGSHRVLVPDRAGYGLSDRVGDLPPDFHRRMAEESLLLLDALGVRDVALWGHSDGAVVAAWAALLAPERIRAVALEALHVTARKPGSVAFFRDGAEDAARFGPAIAAALAADHGADWREVVARGARAWLGIIERGLATGADLFDGRLGELRAPVLLLHGRRDPRTEPGEVDLALRALPAARVAWFDSAHAPHASATEGPRCVAEAVAFLAGHARVAAAR